MPDTFLEAKNELLTYAKRTSTDAQWSLMAGNIINESVVKVQRIIPDLNALGKVVGGFTYTGGLESVSFSDAVENTEINKIISVDETVGTAWTGTPLHCYTYRQLTEMRIAFSDGQRALDDRVTYNTNSFADHIRRTYGKVAVVIGNELQIFPVPGSDLNLAFHYTPWLKRLVADTDTNLILKYCWDFILYASLGKINLFLSESDRIEVSQAFLNVALAELRSWNGSLSYSNPLEM